MFDANRRAKTLRHTTSKSGIKKTDIVLHSDAAIRMEQSFPERLKPQPTGNILMTNYILSCANSSCTKCRVRFNPAPQKDGSSEPPLPIWACSHETNGIFTVRPANVKQTSPLWREQRGFKRHISEGDHAVTWFVWRVFCGGGGLKLKMKMNSSKSSQRVFRLFFFFFNQHAACCDISNKKSPLQNILVCLSDWK